jgi:hypothetical protein
VGGASSQVIVNYAGPGAGSFEIHSAQPGFTTVLCNTTTPPGQPIDRGTCSATVLAGFDITIVAAYDPARSRFSGWPEGAGACATVSTSTAPGSTRTTCHFVASSQDRTFDGVTFTLAPPATQILHIEMDPFSEGSGVIGSIGGRYGISCTVEDTNIVSATGGNCNYSIDSGDTIIVVAGPATRFHSWQGCDVVDSLPIEQCQVTLIGPRTITARFRE